MVLLHIKMHPEIVPFVFEKVHLSRYAIGSFRITNPVVLDNYLDLWAPFEHSFDTIDIWNSREIHRAGDTVRGPINKIIAAGQDEKDSRKE